MSLCVHCDEKILIPVFNDFDQNQTEAFCCFGCMTVFNVINSKGLEKYYEIKKQSAIFKRRSPAESKYQQFSYLDNSEFLSDYSYEDLASHKTMEFYLEGIHCLACLWLIEKLPEYLDDVLICRLDMQRSVATVSLKSEGQFSNIARELNNLGYKPHPLKRNQNINNLKKHEERKMLLKIGIAGAAAGNIMLYAVSIYAGAEGKFAETFNLLTVLFALPVLFYSATPFYSNAWNAIKNKTLSIDIPISMALIMGALSGFYNLFIGVHENFFDSLTALVFLLLLSRYFLNKIQEEGLTANDLNFFYEGNSIQKQVDDTFIEIHPHFLKIDDVIKVSSNEMIPADGIIVQGSSLINNSLLTGESRPVNVTTQDHVFSGTINLANPLLIKVEKIKDDSRIGKILKQIENGWIQKSPIVDLTNKISKYFVAAVFMLAVILFLNLYLQGKTKTALDRAFTLLIVTCPCALALATPLTLTRTLSRASRIGIIIKNNEVIEKLASINTVFLDKTGTLTYGILKVDSFNILSKSRLPIYEIISSLEKYSNHPVATALKEFSLEKNATLVHNVKNYQEIMGSGVSGEINNHFYEIKNGKIFEDNICVAEFSLLDHLRADTNEAVTSLKNLGLNVKMLSGDHQSVALPIAKLAGINDENVFFEITPENKLAMIEKNAHTLMVGDGANDAMALSRAFVSVAVLGSLDISLKAADIYLTTPGISHVANLITISKETMKVVKRNLVLSLIYNSFSVYAAFTGMISPLVAAIIMPLSSLTVLTSTIIGTKKLNAYLKMGAH
ncbi:MAG: heavy metal translocating P-type ATPase [Bacteriovorax sp.]|nr:heavy metal translocating P-type ATPase [Bacteriovorax sp.]